MDTLRRRNPIMALLLVLALVLAACGGETATVDDAPLAEDSPLATEATTTTTAAPETTTTVVEAPAFDLEEAVELYVSTIPEGWMAVGDITAFKDAVDASDALVIDVRTAGEYAEGHILNAINIPLRTLGENLDKIPTDKQVFIYCKSGWRAGLATSSLRLAGYDNVLAFPPGWNGWTEAGEEISTGEETVEVYGDPGFEPELVAAVNEFLSTIPEGFLTAGDAAAVSDAADAGAFLLDVREPGEWTEGRIPGAVNAPVRTLGATDVMIPTDTSVIVYCKSGWRASLTIPVLHILGYDNVKGFSGSYKAWTAADLPVEA